MDNERLQDYQYISQGELVPVANLSFNEAHIAICDLIDVIEDLQEQLGVVSQAVDAASDIINKWRDAR